MYMYVLFNRCPPCEGIDMTAHPAVEAWLQRCKDTMPGYESNEKGATSFGNFVKSKLPK